jgi:hypothetical protein
VTASPSASAYDGATINSRPTAHVVLDTRRISETGIKFLENILYGTDADDPRMPSIREIQELMVLPNSVGSISLKKPGISGTMIQTGNYAAIQLKKPRLSGHN